MADYTCKILTNYFTVINEAEFRELMASCIAEDEIEVFEEANSETTMKFGFGCYGSIDGIPDPSSDDSDEDGSIGLLYESLQKVLHPDDAIIITEIGNEKLNYFTALCTVITKDDVKIDARADAVKLAGDMLGNPGFTTKLDY